MAFQPQRFANDTSNCEPASPIMKVAAVFAAPLEVMVEELKALFDQSGAKGELEIYPEVHHGFAFPLRWCYNKPAAERHWERLITLYKRIQ